jgi:hypothetical protein
MLRPSKKIFFIYFIGLAIAVGLFFLEDTQNSILSLTVGVPITIFDFLTFNSFIRRGCSFLCFPTLSQLIFALIFDLGVLYVLSAAISKLLYKHKK